MASLASALCGWVLYHCKSGSGASLGASFGGRLGRFPVSGDVSVDDCDGLTGKRPARVGCQAIEGNYVQGRFGRVLRS